MKPSVMLDTSANQVNHDEQDSDLSDERVDAKVSTAVSQQSSSSSYFQDSMCSSQDQMSKPENAKFEESP